MTQPFIDSIIKLAYEHGFNAFPDMSMSVVFIQIPDSNGNIKNFSAASYNEALAILGY